MKILFNPTNGDVLGYGEEILGGIEYPLDTGVSPDILCFAGAVQLVNGVVIQNPTWVHPKPPVLPR